MLEKTPNEIQGICRQSNHVWHAMYYDEITEDQDVQLTYMKDADRAYFNCAHALRTIEPEKLDFIEDFFNKKSVQPAIYIDSESPKGLEELLHSRGYQEKPEELEFWYEFPLHAKTMKKLNTETISQTSVRLKFFSPASDAELFQDFLRINGQVNQIPDDMLEKLKYNLLNPKNPSVEFLCAIALVKGCPASIGLVSFYKGIAFLSEGATLLEFRRQGLYVQLNREASIYSGNKGCSRLIVNCDAAAFSNHAFKKIGYQLIGQRRFFQKLYRSINSRTCPNACSN